MNGWRSRIDPTAMTTSARLAISPDQRSSQACVSSDATATTMASAAKKIVSVHSSSLGLLPRSMPSSTTVSAAPKAIADDSSRRPPPSIRL